MLGSNHMIRDNHSMYRGPAAPTFCPMTSHHPWILMAPSEEGMIIPILQTKQLRLREGG